jgi:hypothetical protein
VRGCITLVILVKQGYERNSDLGGHLNNEDVGKWFGPT